MNLDYLGDALDHWKGAMIRFLREQNDLVDLRVLPMITDPDPTQSWGKEIFELYARLLNVKVGDILKQDVQFLPNERREEYFSLDSSYDLFIDPDTGVGNDKKPPDNEKNQRENYILPSEIACLIPDASNSVLVIYQHASWGNTEGKRKHLKGRVNAVKNYLGNHIENRGVFAYFGGQTSMIFISRNSQRLASVCNHLGEFLGPVSQCRLIRTEALEQAPLESE